MAKPELEQPFQGVSMAGAVGVSDSFADDHVVDEVYVYRST
jgi:hypothetical protein